VREPKGVSGVTRKKRRSRKYSCGTAKDSGSISWGPPQPRSMLELNGLEGEALSQSKATARGFKGRTEQQADEGGPRLGLVTSAWRPLDHGLEEKRSSKGKSA